MESINIAIFASGSGTNAQNIIKKVLFKNFVKQIKKLKFFKTYIT